jgi:hypothetical protein
MQDFTKMIHSAGHHCHESYDCFELQPLPSEQGHYRWDSKRVGEYDNAPHQNPLHSRQTSVVNHLTIN